MADSEQDIDLSFLYEIADGSNEFVIESIDMLLQQVPESLRDIEDAINSGEWLVAAGAAHKLKPSMGFFGMLVSQELLKEIETLCKAGGESPLEISSKFREVSKILAENLSTLNRVKAEKQAEL